MSSYYEVFLSDAENEPVSIFEPDKKEMSLLNAVVSLAVREAGSFTFTIPPMHIFYDSIIPYGSTIEVRENNKTIFFGRPLPPTTDFWGNKTYHCEGALAFLNDVILPPLTYLGETTLDDLIMQVLDEYNMHQTRYDREMRYDVEDFPQVTIYDPDEWNYQTALDYIRNYLFQFCGGFFYAEWDGTEILFKWKEKLEETNNQPVTFGVNLLDIMREGKNFYTGAIAKGGKDIDGIQAQMMRPVFMSNALRNKYGTTIAYLEYPDAQTVDALEAYCTTFLQKQQFNGASIELTAADMGLLPAVGGFRYDEFRIGQLVHVTSQPQSVDTLLPVTRLDVDINSMAKNAIIGTLDVVPLTISTMKVQVQAEKKAKEIAKKVVDKDNAKAKPTTIKGSDGNDYGLDIDSGGMVIAVKIPSHIMFTRTVDKYHVGDVLNISDYEVTAYYGDGTDEVVTNECKFNPEDGYTFISGDSHYQLTAIYTVGGKNLAASTKLQIIKDRGKPNNNYEPPTGQYKFPDDANITIGAFSDSTPYPSYQKPSNKTWLPMQMPTYSVYLTNRESGFYNLFSKDYTFGQPASRAYFCDLDIVNTIDGRPYPIADYDDPTFIINPTSFSYSKNGKTVYIVATSDGSYSRIGDLGIGGDFSIYYAHTDRSMWYDFANACWEVVFGAGIID